MTRSATSPVDVSGPAPGDRHMVSVRSQCPMRPASNCPSMPSSFSSVLSTTLTVVAVTSPPAIAAPRNAVIFMKFDDTWKHLVSGVFG